MRDRKIGKMKSSGKYTEMRNYSRILVQKYRIKYGHSFVAQYTKTLI